MSQPENSASEQPNGRRLRFDWTINVGTMVQLALLGALLLKSYIDISYRLASVETKVAIIFTWWERIGK